MTNEQRDIIDRLSGSEARSILKALAKENIDLAIRVREMAYSCLARVDVEEVAGMVYADLEALDVEDVRDRAWPSSDGYVEQGETAGALVESVLAHFFFEVRKYQELGMPAQAKQVCQGLLLGLYMFEHKADTEFKDRVTHAPLAWAEEVMRAWKMGRPGLADVQEMEAFVAEKLADWRDALIQPRKAAGSVKGQEP